MGTLLEDLRTALRRVLAETTFETRRVDLPPFAGSPADGRDRPPETLTPRDLRETYERLRIALEALLLPDNPNPQLGFTAATRGAWLVGEDGAGRRKAWKTLRSAYHAGSKAVHRGEVKGIDGNVEVLLAARDLCRNGLLRVLLKGRIQDWTGLILNCPDTDGDSPRELRQATL